MLDIRIETLSSEGVSFSRISIPNMDKLELIAPDYLKKSHFRDNLINKAFLIGGYYGCYI